MYKRQVWQLSQNVVLIDFAKKDFQLFQPVFGGGKAGLFLTDFRCLLAVLCFLHHPDKLGSVITKHYSVRNKIQCAMAKRMMRTRRGFFFLKPTAIQPQTFLAVRFAL